MNYTQEQVQSLSDQTFAYLLVEEKDHVLHLRLNRPAKKNALNPTLLWELTYALSYAHYTPSVRAVVIAAEGNVFCAGADLKAFMGGGDKSGSTIPKPENEILLGEIFHQVHKPTLARVEGSVFAGGFLILANCTYVIANHGIRLGLPEVKRGLFPYQVMASLMEVMPRRQVLDWCLRGTDLSVEKALDYGLITHLVSPETGEVVLTELLNELLENSPMAIRMGLEAYDTLRSTDPAEHHQYLKSMLFRSIQTPDAREGIAAFREKRKPVWPD